MQKWWWPPWMASQDHGIHSFEECVIEGSDYFQQTLGRRRNSTHNKRIEDGSNWRSSSHHPRKIPQAMRNTKESTLEEPLIHLSIWIRNDELRRWWSWRLKRRLPTKQIKISIQLSFHDIVLIMHLFIFSWCIMHNRMFAVMTIYY